MAKGPEPTQSPRWLKICLFVFCLFFWGGDRNPAPPTPTHPPFGSEKMLFQTNFVIKTLDRHPTHPPTFWKSKSLFVCHASAFTICLAPAPLTHETIHLSIILIKHVGDVVDFFNFWFVVLSAIWLVVCSRFSLQSLANPPTHQPVLKACLFVCLFLFEHCLFSGSKGFGTHLPPTHPNRCTFCLNLVCFCL